MTDLPRGWSTAKIADIAVVQGGIQKQPKRRPISNKYPFLRVANVLRNRLDLNEVHEVELFDGELERYRLAPGDLLVVEGNGSPSQIGRSAMWLGEIQDCVHQNHLIRVRPGPAVIPGFLNYFWNSPATTEHLRSLASSTSGLYVLTTAKVKSVAVPLPPRAEQERIVAAIEEEFSRIDAAEDSLRTVERKVEILAEAWVRVASQGHPVPLRDLLVEPLSNGRSVPTAADGFPVLRLTALRDGRIDLTERKTGAWSKFEAERFLVKRGDFLVSRGNGSLRLVGLGALVDTEPDDVAFPDTMVRARVDSSRVDPRFLRIVWNGPKTRNQIEGVARTTAGIYKVNQQDLARVVVPVPPLEAQREIVVRSERQASVVDTVSTTTEHALIRAEHLRRSILRQAFSGRLVPQDPTDESALVHLARITANRSPATEPRRRKGA